LAVLFLLVASSIVAITGSMALSHWTTSGYADAVDTNRRWAARLELVGELEDLANTVDAPGNDVFARGDAAAELKKQQIAYRLFQARLGAIQDGIMEGIPTSHAPRISKALIEASNQVERINVEGELTLQTYAAGDEKRAGVHMATMDQTMRAFLVTTASIKVIARELRQANFDVQASKAARARAAEKLVGVGIGALVCFLGIYGFKLYRLTDALATDRERAGADLAVARDAADGANRAKSEFLANMSHEIRTPITAIVGFSDMMLDPVQSQSDRFDGLQTIRRNAQHLLALINDILDISKIEAGKMTVERIDCDLTLLLGEVMSMLQPRAVEKGMAIQLVLDTPVPRTICTDPLRLKQVIVNLLSNAIKFTPDGQVRVHIAHPAGGGPLHFSVVDGGIGMTQEQMSRLFQPFAQADGSTTRRFGGSGLGLTISKRLAELLGGDITVSSESGRGSTFRVSIDPGAVSGPLVSSIEETMLQTDDAATRDDINSLKISGRILLAEDGLDNQRFISAMLRRVGAEVVIARNGKIAVELALAEAFDMIFMDMQMPEMDGYAATSKLRSRGCRLPIVALTAHAMTEDRAKCMQAGCTDYLTKPIDRIKLIKTAGKYIAVTAIANAAAAATAANAQVLQVVPGDASPRILATRLPPAPTLFSTFANDPVMAEILPEFVANLPTQAAALMRFIEEDFASELRETIHQIKGAGGTYGFDPITVLAAAIDARLRSGAVIEAVNEDVQSLLHLLRSVSGYDRAAENAMEAAAPA
jgi:signal transduction histidine kinase/DNA-binding NarL/FixJ family response regulator/HPt (histidine-containing phosphotransfer) domain-containing protein